MKRRKIISLVVLISCSVYLLVSNIGSEEDVSIDVYFCPEDNCSSVLESLVYLSDDVVCALYDLDDPQIIGAFEKKDAEIVLDSDIDDEPFDGLSYTKRDPTGIMHNKFCVFDGESVFTGSYNPTLRGTEKNDNNMLIINSTRIAKLYSDYFIYLKDGKDLDGKDLSGGKGFDLLNGKLDVYFCPLDDCVGAVSESLLKAEESIYFMTFSFTHKTIAADIILKHHEGISVKGVFERSQNSRYSVHDVMEFNGVDVRIDGNRYNMHNKVFIIDGEVVVTGSFNPSLNAASRNDENLIIIEDKALSEKYLDAFWEVWRKSQV